MIFLPTFLNSIPAFEVVFPIGLGIVVFYHSKGAMIVDGTYEANSYILQKGNGELKKSKGLIFKKDMSEYFSDCPALVEKISLNE